MSADRRPLGPLLFTSMCEPENAGNIKFKEQGMPYLFDKRA